jgi:hypothetical protein
MKPTFLIRNTGQKDVSLNDVESLITYIKDNIDRLTTTVKVETQDRTITIYAELMELDTDILVSYFNQFVGREAK